MEQTLTIRRILIAVENSAYSERACEYGFLLAAKVGAEVALLHAYDIPPPIVPATDPLMSEPQALVPEIMHIQEETGKQLLDRMSEKFGKEFNVYTFNRLGDPEEEILATATEWHADMILVGTHGRTGLDHFLSGSVAESVVRKSKCPVLIIPKEKS
jgi:nucleotide-binding universal stress UspA family protein